ncbi:hypothetical protein LAZ67_X003342, partial [Cordylochernes scorpioides]
MVVAWSSEAHREDLGLHVRRPTDDGECLSEDAAALVSVGQQQVPGATGDTDNLARPSRVPRKRQGVQGQPQNDVCRMAPKGAAAERRKEHASGDDVNYRCIAPKLIRIHVWRHPGESTLPVCFPFHHTGPSLRVMVWGGLGYTPRSPLVSIP